MQNNDKQQRAELQKLFVNWLIYFLDEHYGVNGWGTLEASHPSLELVTLRQVRPFEYFVSDDPEHMLHNYLQLLDLENDYNTWESASLPGLMLRLPGRSGHDEEFGLVLAANEREMRDAIASDEIALQRELGLDGRRSRREGPL
jgi:hypothetical protein